MSAAYTVTDHGGHVANVILNNGRNEVQLYRFSAQNDAESAVPLKKFELEGNQNILCAAWLDNSIRGAAKTSTKRKSEDSAAQNGSANGHGPSNLLAVGLSSDEVWVLSPHSDEPVAKIQGTYISLTASSIENCFWGLTEQRSLVEVNAVSGDTVKTIKFGKTDANASLIRYTSHKLKLKGAAQLQPLVVASSHLHLVDCGRSRRHLVAEFTEGSDSADEKNTIAYALVTPDGLSVVVGHEGSTELYVYDIADPLQAPASFQTRGSTVFDVQCVSDELAVAFTLLGAEVLSLKDDSTEPLALIRTTSKNVLIESIFATESGLVGVWYDGVQPHFVPLDSTEGDVEVEVHYKNGSASHEADETADITFSAVEHVEIENVAATELYSRLSALLLAPKVKAKDVVKLCSANDSEDTIKHTMREFSYSEKCSQLVDRLFSIVAAKVAADASRKSLLSVWLKWILLAHGGYISKQELLRDELQALQRSLDDGMKTMKLLLALQGRMLLLQSQAELRNGLQEHSESESEIDAFQETFNNTTNVEELVVYANGENDDFEGTA